MVAARGMQEISCLLKEEAWIRIAQMTDSKEAFFLEGIFESAWVSCHSGFMGFLPYTPLHTLRCLWGLAEGAILLLMFSSPGLTPLASFVFCAEAMSSFLSSQDLWLQVLSL